MKGYQTIPNTDYAIDGILNRVDRFIQKQEHVLKHYNHFALHKIGNYMSEVNNQIAWQAKETDITPICDMNNVGHDNFMSIKSPKKTSQLQYIPQNLIKIGSKVKEINQFMQKKFQKEQRILKNLEKQYLPLNLQNKQQFEDVLIQKYRKIKQLQQSQELQKMKEAERMKRKHPVNRINLKNQRVIFEYDGKAKKLQQPKPVSINQIISLQSSVSLTKNQQGLGQKMKKQINVEECTIQHKMLISNSQRSFINDSREENNSSLKRKLRILQNKNEVQFNANQQSELCNSICINQRGIKLTINEKNIFMNKSKSEGNKPKMNRSNKQKSSLLRKQMKNQTSFSQYQDSKMDLEITSIEKNSNDFKKFKALYNRNTNSSQKQRVSTHNEHHRQFLIQQFEREQFDQEQMQSKQQKHHKRRKSLLNRLLNGSQRNCIESSQSQNIDSKTQLKQKDQDKNMNNRINNFKINMKRLIKRDDRFLTEQN